MKLKISTLLIVSICWFSAMAQYQVGSTTITFTDASRSNRQIETAVYYPATTSGVNASAATGVFPVITFGHGFAMTWDAYQDIWEHYSALGYIVAFPKTESSLFPSPSHSNFGLDLAFVSDAIQSENSNTSSILFQKVSPNAAIMGHSMGGGATILAGANNSTIKTIIGLAPAETNPSAIAAAANVTVPTIIFSGTQDGVTPPNDHHIPIYDGIAANCKAFVSIVGGGHCYFANSNFNCDFGETTSSTGISITRTEQQSRTFSLLDLWLDSYLRNNSASYTSFLNSLNATPTTITGQTTCNYLALNELNSSQMVFYPNPTNDFLYFENATGGLVEVIVYDLYGHELLRQITMNQLDVNFLAAGIYTLKVNDNYYSFLKK